MHINSSLCGDLYCNMRRDILCAISCFQENKNKYTAFYFVNFTLIILDVSFFKFGIFRAVAHVYTPIGS